MREDIDDLGRISRLQQTLAYLLLLQALRQSRQQRHVLFLVFERRDQQRDDVYGLAIGRAKVNAGLRDADGQELALDPVLVCVGYGHALANARRGLLLAPNQSGEQALLVWDDLVLAQHGSQFADGVEVALRREV